MKKKSKKRFLLLFVLLVLILLFARFILLPMIYPLEHKKTIDAAAIKYGLDKELVYAVIYAESGFDELAVSYRGAMGLMQIMPETGAWLADKMDIIGYSDEMLFDANINIDIGTYYLAMLLAKYDGEFSLALSAYNAGGGNVDKWLDNPELSSDKKTLDKIPFNETKNYVKKVMMAKKIYKMIYGG